MTAHTCWKCGASLRVDVGQPGGVTRTTSNRLRDAFRPRRFQHTAPSPWAGPQHNQPAPPQVSASPGETIYRTPDDVADRQVQARMGWQCAGYVVVLGACVVAAQQVPVIAPAAWLVGMGDVVAAAVFVRLNWDMLVLGKRDHLVTRTRNAETAPETTRQTVTVKAEMREGRKTLYDEFAIADYAAWHRFCKSVHFRNKRFSGAQSKRDKVPVGDWDTVTRVWVTRGWLLPFRAGETPELTARGRAWVRAYATTPPQSPGDETG